MTTRPRDDDYESFATHGVVAERQGRVTRMYSTLDDAEMRQMRAALGKSVTDIKNEMSCAVTALYQLLHSYRPESVLGALCFRNLSMRQATGSHIDTSGEPAHAFVDYVATLYIRDPGAGGDLFVPPHVVEDIQNRVQSLFIRTAWLWMAQDAARHGSTPDDGTRQLWFMSLYNALIVRYHGHFDHMVGVLRGIEEELPHDLSDTLGWSIRDAASVGSAIITLLDMRLNANISRAGDEAQRIWTSAWPKGDGRIARLVKRIVPPERRPRAASRLHTVSAWFAFLMQHAPCFTALELAKAADVEPDRVSALLQQATLPWESCKEDYFMYPHPTPPIQFRPCISLADGRFLIPSPLAFSWAIKGLVESALKENSTESSGLRWESFKAARSVFAEKGTLNSLSSALPKAGSFRSLKYSWFEDGTEIQGELDGLLILDDTALLVEVKSGSLTPEARRGAPNRLREQLDELVGTAHRQALKAKAFLMSAPRVTFRVDHCADLVVRSKDLNQYFLMTVNLDPLELYTANLRPLIEMEILGQDDLPWAVSYMDLLVICDAIEFPAQLFHFLKRRKRIHELGFVEAHDELDWLGHYLKEGLFFEHLAQEVEASRTPTYSIVGYSEDIDAHYMHDKRHSGPAPPIPRQPMPEAMREVLQELEDNQLKGYLHVSEALLDLSLEARERFFVGVRRQIARTKVDGAGHDMSMVLDDDHTGITFMCETEKERLRDGLQDYCILKRYQCKCDRWIGFGTLIGTGRWVDVAVVLKGQWEYDESLEDLARRAFPKHKASASSD